MRFFVSIRRVASAVLVILLMCTGVQAQDQAFHPLRLFLSETANHLVSPNATTTTLDKLPLTAQYAVSAVQGEYNDAYAFNSSADRVQAHNPGQAITVRFEAGTMTYAVGDDSMRLTLLDMGYETALHPIVEASTLEPVHNRLEIVRGELTEWYVNGSLGVQQGFTLHQRPATGAGNLQLRIALDGTLSVTLKDDHLTLIGANDTHLTYGGLLAYDAQGTELPAHFGFADGILSLLVDDQDAVYPITIDPLVQQAYLKASNTGAGDGFGQSVAISGDTLVVGAYQEDSNATGVNGNQANNTASNAGAVYVLVRSGGVWSQEAYLKASNTNANDLFGYSVAISGDTLVVGAYQEDSNATGVNGNQASNTAPDSGAAYVFVRSAGVWTQQAYLKASNTNAGDQFGLSVRVSNDTIVVGAYLEDSNATGVNGNQANNTASNAGAAYVFVRSAGVWTQQAYLKASNTNAVDLFGYSVDISGDTIIVGAYGESSNATTVNGNQADNSASGAGAAYVFVRSAGVWTQQAYLKASNAEANDIFGFSAAISGDTIVIGAYQEDSSATGVNGNGADNSATFSGAAYVFVRSAGVWSQQAYLKASNTEASDFFAYSVAISGDMIVVGANGEDSSATGVNGNEADNSLVKPGAAYVYERSGGAWSQQAYLKASNPGLNDIFGLGIAVSSDTIVVSAYLEDSSATGANGDQADNSAADSGAVYVFVPGQTATVAFDAATSSAAEASGFGNLLRVTTSDGNPTATAATVTVSVTGGTATTADYALTGTITIPAGTPNNALISIASGITVTDETLIEVDETVSLQLSAPVGTLLGAQTTTTHTIVNDDTATVTIIANDPGAAENPIDPGQFTISMSAANGTGADITVNYTVTGSATPGADYTILSGSAVIVTGSSSVTLDVLTAGFDDALADPAETVIVVLNSTSSSSVTVGTPSGATVMIADDETAGYLITPLIPATVSESGGAATFTIRLTTMPTGTVTLDFASLDLTECFPSPPTSWTFDNTNWNVALTVTFNAANDTLQDGTQLCPISITRNASSTAAEYIALPDPPNIVLTVLDDEASIVPTASGGNSTTVSTAVPQIQVFDPAISKLGFLMPGQSGTRGERIEWIVTVINTGQGTGTNVVVTDTLHSALTIDRVSAPDGTVSINEQTVRVTFASIQPGQAFQFSIFTTATSGITVDNTACVEAAEIVTECVTAPAIQSLPRTGETPLWSQLLRGLAMLFVVVSVLVVSTSRIRIKRETH